MVPGIAEASGDGAEGCLAWRGQISAARKLSSDRLHNLFDFDVRFRRPLLGDSHLCFGLAEAVFGLRQFFGFLHQLSPSDLEIGTRPRERSGYFLHCRFRFSLRRFGALGSSLFAFQLFDN